MTSECDDLDDLQEQVMADARATFSEMVLDHAMRPRNVGRMPNADGFGRIKGPCGDTMEIRLRLRDEKITGVAFWTDGCGTSIAAGSMATELINGKSVTEAQRIQQEDVLNALGGLPAENEHCALLAANTVKEAIKDYLATKSAPWKRAYRKT